MTASHPHCSPACPSPLNPKNHHVHADLFGALKTTGCGKKFILCMTDALTKSVKLVPLPNREVATVAQAIFDIWYCCFGAPLDIVTEKSFVLNFQMSCSKGLALHTSQLCLTIFSAAKQKLQIRPLQNIWQASATILHWTGKFTSPR